MAHTVNLDCFSPDFTSSTSIAKSTFENIVAQNEKLKLETDGDRLTLMILKENSNEWFPMLWIYDDYAYFHSNPIFDYDLYYDLISIAQSANASIITQDGILLYIPQYGILYDPEEKESIEIEIGELIDEIGKTENLALAIREITLRKNQAKRGRQEEINRIQEKRRKREENYEKQRKLIAKFESKQHYVAIVMLSIMLLLLVYKKFFR